MDSNIHLQHSSMYDTAVIIEYRNSMPSKLPWAGGRFGDISAVIAHFWPA